VCVRESFDGSVGTGGSIQLAFRRCKSHMIATSVSSTHLDVDEKRNKTTTVGLKEGYRGVGGRLSSHFQCRTDLFSIAQLATFTEQLINQRVTHKESEEFSRVPKGHWIRS